MRGAVRSRHLGLLLSGSVIAGFAASSAVHAQSTPAPVSLARSPVDENGVNVATGKMQIPTTELAIGPSGRGGLRYTGHIGSGTSPLHRYPINSYAIAESAGGGLILGSSGKNFSGTVATDGSGETYANGVYTMRDGTKVDITALPPPPPRRRWFQ